MPTTEPLAKSYYAQLLRLFRAQTRLAIAVNAYAEMPWDETRSTRDIMIMAEAIDKINELVRAQVVLEMDLPVAPGTWGDVHTLASLAAKAFGEGERMRLMFIGGAISQAIEYVS